MRELMESVPGILSSRVAHIGLDINPNKTNLILFSRKYTNSGRLPWLGGRELLLSAS